MDGVDLFDLTRSRMASASGILLDDSGPRQPCSELGENSSIHSQIKSWQISLAKVRFMIKSNTLRNLVQASVLSSPKQVERLRRFDRLCSEQEGLLSSIPNGNSFDSYSHDILNDPLIKD